MKVYASSGYYYLNIKGNILVDGDIEIDENIRYPKKQGYLLFRKRKTDYYRQYKCFERTLPNPISGFPVSNLLTLMAVGDLNISVDNYNHNPGDYNDPDVRILGIAGGTALLSSYNAVRGSLISNGIDARDASGLLGILLEAVRL